MCGIVGWINLSKNIKGFSELIKAMMAKLSNRGPNSTGMWASEHALIGHARLVVIDPVGGSQPMTYTDNDRMYVLTYNGELYNTQDLRNELQLKGHFFSTNSDTEVLLHSFIEWGASCVEKLNGIFAFGVWDEKKQRLFLARDRFGVKPLFFTLHQNSIIFGSEIKAILTHPEIKPKVDREGLAEIFALGPSRTPGHGVFKGIHELRPAHCMMYDSDGAHIKRYWNLQSKVHQDNLEDTIYTVRLLLKDSIEKQLISDVPICTFLSGGLDSSIVSAIAAIYFKDTGKGQLHTYSIDYVNNEKFFVPNDFQPNLDSDWIKIVSSQFNTIHHYIKVDTPEVVSALSASLYARDLPGMVDIDSSLWLFCREVKKDAVVALSGECADEYGYSNTTYEKARIYGLFCDMTAKN